MIELSFLFVLSSVESLSKGEEGSLIKDEFLKMGHGRESKGELKDPMG